MAALPIYTRLSYLPVLVALIIVLVGGIWLLDRSDKQARDTIRKHHLEDLEQSLFFARRLHGTYPPYDQASWCGTLNDPRNAVVREQVEATLRAQNEKYGNENKPFPTDPLAQDDHDYFYWKRSPALFELYAILEADKTGERQTTQCEPANYLVYDYGLASVLREDRISATP